MYLHHLTDSREAGERLERLFRWARGRRTPAMGSEEIPTTVLKAGGNVAIRMEIPGMDLNGVRVDGDVVLIKLAPRVKGPGDDTKHRTDKG
jgi:HSP20 family molecular chaperone IbpA